jgi:predicted RNA binding protein YcfA (HicA-like mRNA interferase family)
MPKLRRMSGDEVAAILSKHGFNKVSQRGSHMKLRRLVGGSSQALTIPAHHELDSGTLRLSSDRPRDSFPRKSCFLISTARPHRQSSLTAWEISWLQTTLPAIGEEGEKLHRSNVGDKWRLEIK